MFPWVPYDYEKAPVSSVRTVGATMIKISASCEDVTDRRTWTIVLQAPQGEKLTVDQAALLADDLRRLVHQINPNYYENHP